MKKDKPEDKPGTKDSEKSGKKNESNNSNKNEKKAEGGGGAIKNPCGLPRHSKHDYKDCKYNKNSKSFCGTVMTKDFNKDGSKKRLPWRSTPALSRWKM